MEFLIPRKYLIAVDPGWNRWDLEIYRGIWSKLRLTVAAENHGGSKRLSTCAASAAHARVRLALAGLLVAVVCGLVFYLPNHRVGAASARQPGGHRGREPPLGAHPQRHARIVAGRSRSAAGERAAPAKAQAA